MAWLPRRPFLRYAVAAALQKKEMKADGTISGPPWRYPVHGAGVLLKAAGNVFFCECGWRGRRMGAPETLIVPYEARNRRDP